MSVRYIRPELSKLVGKNVRDILAIIGSSTKALGIHFGMTYPAANSLLLSCEKGELTGIRFLGLMYGIDEMIHEAEHVDHVQKNRIGAARDLFYETWYDYKKKGLF